MAGIDQFLQHPAIEMQPGQLAIDEAFGAFGNRRDGLDIRFFLFNYNSLCGFHENSVHFESGYSAVWASAAQSLCYRNDVSMTIDVPASRRVNMRPAYGLPSNSAASARVTGRPSRRASRSRNSTACRTAA